MIKLLKGFVMKKEVALFLFCLPLLFLRVNPLVYGISVIGGSFYLIDNGKVRFVQVKKKSVADLFIIFGSVLLIYAEAILRFKGYFRTPDWHNMQSYMPNYSLVIYFVLGVIFYRRYNQHSKKTDFKKGLLILLPVFINNITYSLILPQQIVDGNWLEISSIAFQTIVIASIMEEIFFRGFLYSGIKACFGVTMATILSSGVFSLWHFNVLGTLVTENGIINLQSIWQLFVIFILGVVNCIAFERSKRLVVPIVYHIVNNGLCYIAISYMLA